MKSLHLNKLWVLVSVPSGKTVVECNWIYKVKKGVTEYEPFMFKARFVNKGFSQVEGVDYK